SMIEGNTSYLRSKASQRSTELAGTIDNFMNRMEAIFWPVFLDEIKVSNGVLKQNPAFGSGESSSVKQN
ncbi:MAG: RagB/SusD family nutrient uptake outer membrane protein, partial [Bacteroidales bacterium]|nr:RagB/SusD family nutrient uptake outer membrane protein [Bacteroidales bacterium]